MATRPFYYTGDDDIYSRLMAEYAAQQPIYTAPSAPTGLLGGFAPASSAALTTAPVRRPVDGGVPFDGGYSGSDDPNNAFNAWGKLTPLEQAQFYSMNPGWAKATSTLQNLFGYTALGALQKAMVPGFVAEQKSIPSGEMLANYMAQYDPFGNLLDVGKGLVQVTPLDMQSASPATIGYDQGGFGAYGENVAPTASLGNDTIGFGSYGEQTGTPGEPTSGVVVGGPIGPSYGDISVSNLGGYGAAGETAPGGSGFGSDIGFDYGIDSPAMAEAAAAAPAPGAPDGGYGSYGENVAPSGDGGDGGGGGGKIICTKLYHLGKMPREIFEADQAFGKELVKQSPETYAGYVIWARHVVRWMSREDWIGKAVVAITNAIATPWSVAMAEEMGVNVKSNAFGRFLLKRGLQMCRLIGNMKKQGGLKNV